MKEKLHKIVKKIKLWISGVRKFFYKHKIKSTVVISIFSLIIAYYIIPQNNYLNDVWLATTNCRVSASRVISLCNSFKDTSNEEKLKNGFEDTLIEYKKIWENDQRKFTVLSERVYLQGLEIHLRLGEFNMWNWNQIDYIDRYRACPLNLLSDDQLQYLEERTIEPFPKTILEYINFYLIIFSWKASR
ncbi:MAG: hypothetical protein ACP5OE_06245 [Thermodesulfobium sp.]